MLTTPLCQEHIKLGAKMSPFAGWDMPIQYTGIIEEHIHTRAKAGLFDICHMGEFIIRGKSALNDVSKLVTSKIDDMPIGRCRYGFLLNDKGTIIDDLITFRDTDDEFMLVVNAATIEKDKQWIKSHLSPNTYFEDISTKTAKLDLQGPLSKDILSAFTDANLDDIKKYHFITTKISGIKAIISRTGYTGELGYEIFFDTPHAVKIWRMLLDNKDVRPIGLGARDTLRLEMGYSLYGQDIDESRTPIEAGLEKFIDFNKDFIGKAALLLQKQQGIEKVLSGFVSEGRRSPRHNFNVLKDNKLTGIVTSASFSPCLKKAIGLCYIDTNTAKVNEKIVLSDNNVFIDAVIRKPPFITK